MPRIPLNIRTCVCLSLLPVLAAMGCRPTGGQVPFDAHREYDGQLPVFPGAQGFGTCTPAGRGGPVIPVTSLEPEGPGSLAEALAAKGPRTIVFEVGGVIDRRRSLRITQPFVTVGRLMRVTWRIAGICEMSMIATLHRTAMM